MIGWLPIGIMGFGMLSEYSRIRVPMPPQNKMTFMLYFSRVDDDGFRWQRSRSKARCSVEITKNTVLTFVRAQQQCSAGASHRAYHREHH
jgi:hypothetical protein